MVGDYGETTSRFPAGLSAAEFALVARLPIFAGLDEARMRRLLDHSAVRPFGRNAVLFLQEESATCFYVILDGWVRLYRQTSRGKKAPSRCTPGAIPSPRPRSSRAARFQSRL